MSIIKDFCITNAFDYLQNKGDLIKELSSAGEELSALLLACGEAEVGDGK